MRTVHVRLNGWSGDAKKRLRICFDGGARVSVTWGEDNHLYENKETFLLISSIAARK